MKQPDSTIGGGSNEFHKLLKRRMDQLDREVVAIKADNIKLRAEVHAGSQKAVVTALNRIADNLGDKLESIEKGGTTIMSKIDDLVKVLDGMGAKVDAIAADEKVLVSEIQSLKDVIAAGGTVTEAQVQSALDKAQAISDRLDAIDASVPGNTGPVGP